MDVNGNREKIRRAAELSGLGGVVSALEKEWNTNLGCELFEDGVLLSGGEMQKTVLARIFYTDYCTLILDEASASLDPISEYNFYESINARHGNSTTIVISHRLSAAKGADRIYMFSDGKIIEQGTHEQLMRKTGEYASFFRLQAEKYK
jgi:ABC-type multidrug transport system fused ATPase/permease subunit